MKKNTAYLSIFLTALLLPWTSRAFAEKGFFSRYNFGVTYEGTQGHAEIVYDTPTTKEVPENCEPNTERAGVFRCTAYLGPDGDGSPSPGLFLEAPFKREGLFYFEPGFTFSTVSYKGSLISKPSSAPSGVKTGPQSGAQGKKEPPTQPLTQAHLEFYGINLQGYVRFGITPRYIPDILISMGGGIQMAGGRVKIFTDDYTKYIVQPEFFGELELVLIRAHTGALSIFYGQDQSFVSQIGTTLVDDFPAGSQLSNVRLGLSAASAGLRLLFPF